MKCLVQSLFSLKYSKVYRRIDSGQKAKAVKILYAIQATGNGQLARAIAKLAERRNLGAHYTSEKNILKLIKPLFTTTFRGLKCQTKNKLKLLKRQHN